MAARKTIIVTRASRGIGHATALKFHAEGSREFAAELAQGHGAVMSPGTPAIVEREIPMRRLGTIEEMADLIWFLCSTRAPYVTGAEIPIIGGQHG